MKNKKVLIVDDNELNRKLFENLVGQLYDFKSARNGMEAIAIATTTPFDLILMDIQMPRMDGITAMKRIRENDFGACPILAVTAFADDGDKQSFLDQGFDDFIAKPIRPREFILTIQSFLKKPAEQERESEKQQREEEVLNLETLKQLLKYNSQEAIKKVYLDFISECDEMISAVEKHESDEISADLMDKIHTIKGNSGTLGVTKMFKQAQVCELFGRQNKSVEFLEQAIILKKYILEFQEFFYNETIFES